MSLGWTLKFLSPWEADGMPNFYNIFMDYGTFDPLRVKISTHLCFMFYYIMGFICHQETLEISPSQSIDYSFQSSEQKPIHLNPFHSLWYTWSWKGHITHYNIMSCSTSTSFGLRPYAIDRQKNTHSTSSLNLRWTVTDKWYPHSGISRVKL